MMLFGFRRLPLPLLGLLLSLLAATARAEDVVEFLSGSRMEGKVTEIRKAEKEFDFAAKLGSRTVTRTFAFATVHAVTLDGKRHVLTPLAGESGGPRAAAEGETSVRSPAEVNRLIEEAGKTPPEWFDQTAFDHPPTLDLSWPQKPEGGWNNQKNMGQYFWDIVNPNPHRWRAGIKLVHHCLTLHQDDPALLERDMQKLGMAYFELLQDYPRAAFWLRRAGVKAGDPQSVALAECYWRMGSKPMALELLRTRSLPVHAIKLFGDMGETQRAVQLAEAAARSSAADEANLLAGDALRQAGQYPAAIQFYQRVLSSSDARNEEYEQRYRARARESIEAIELFEQADLTQVADGTYAGTATGYNGAIDVEVRVQDGEIESVEVTEHQEKQFYSAIDDTPRRIIEAQSVRGIDAISRATITSQAIVNATARALAGKGQ